MPQDSNPLAITFKKSGELTQDIEGVTTVVATFDRKTGHLEYETQEFANKLVRQITAAIGTTNKGQTSSGLIISTMSVKGQAKDEPKGVIPKKPKRDPQYGDQTPELVKWYFDYYPHEAYLRYGVFLDADGKPIVRKVKRKTTEIIDDRDGEMGIEEANEGKGERKGPKTWEKGPITTRAYLETTEGIIARRATCMTYAPQEVIGGFDMGDEEQDTVGYREET